MQEHSEKQKEEILQRLQRINFLRKFIDPEEDSSGTITEAALYLKNDNLFDLAEKVALYDATDQIMEQDPFFPYPHAEDAGDGEIRLGTVIQTGDPVYLKLDSLNKNLLIIGAHGKGKTNLINIIIKGLLGR